MAAPPSVTKVTTKQGVAQVTFTDSVDRTQYFIDELVRAALRDVGKYVCKVCRLKVPKRTGRLRRNIQYWVRKKENDLIVGYKAGGFYGGYFELGTEEIQPQHYLYNSVYENIDTIREIEGKYLSAIEDENRAAALIDEDETISDDEE